LNKTASPWHINVALTSGKEFLKMGRDEHKTGGNNSSSLPQTPKNQKIKPGNMAAEMAEEFAELTGLKPKRERMIPNEKKRK
jgi:hypothetical protein